MPGFVATMSIKDIVELVAAAMLPLGFILFMVHRMVVGRPLGARAIQFLGVVFLLPIILILALEKILDGTTIGTLIGAITGYLLSNITNYDFPARNDDAKRP
jgi:hypothetical protein